ncbi:hypothetical protein RR46_11666 [Papilio xuthus]|uniref:Uncharacterized protein n=1 Tax=Papilio xuthus TaxID=66420 RepID=A0A194PSK8_PAPXU|nr:hypothetical protein RR46_11666 [Papilio xuthus]
MNSGETCVGSRDRHVPPPAAARRRYCSMHAPASPNSPVTHCILHFPSFTTKMFKILVVMALLSMSFAAPLDLEETDFAKDSADIDLTGHEPSESSDEGEPNTNGVQAPSTEPTDRSADVVRHNGSFLSYLECVGGRYPIDPYFNPYFRVKMQDPLYRRWLKQKVFTTCLVVNDPSSAAGAVRNAQVNARQMRPTLTAPLLHYSARVICESHLSLDSTALKYFITLT